MPTFLSQAAILIAQICALFFLSRISTQTLFRLFHTATRSQRLVFSLIAIIFLPGTIVHELSHFFMATILFLRVVDISIFPEWHEDTIKLGSVVYEKKDVLRSILVGIAPIITGLLFFLWLYSLNIQLTTFTLQNVFVVYIIFVVSSTMFSSKQDLVDIIYLIPIFIIGAVVYYFFSAQINFFIPYLWFVLENSTQFIYAINRYLFISIIIHVITIASITLFFRLIKR